MRTRTAALVAALTLTMGALAAAPSSAAPTSTAPSGGDGVTIERGPGFTAAGGAVGTAAANIRGGSIVFIRGGNVWLVRGDGSGLYQVTRDGGYKEPSMSDNGTIVAAKGGAFVVMRQNGVVLRAFKPEDLFVPSPDVMNLSPAFGPMISPDGSKIAYSQARARNVGGKIVAEGLTSVTSSSHATVATINIGSASAWLTNNRFLYTRSDARIADVGATGSSWFEARDIDPVFDEEFSYYDVYSASLAPNGKSVVMNIEGSILATAKVTGDPRTSVPGAPTGHCYVTTTATTSDPFSSATFSPDSTSIAYTEQGRLTVVSNIDVCNESSKERVLLSGAADPFWSKAALNPPARPGTKPGTTAPARKFALKVKPKVTGKARVGRKLTVTAGRWSPNPGQVTYRWYRGTKLIKGKAGAKRVYKLKKADRGKRLRVKVTVKRSGYKSSSVWSARTKKVKR